MVAAMRSGDSGRAEDALVLPLFPLFKSRGLLCGPGAPAQGGVGRERRGWPCGPVGLAWVMSGRVPAGGTACGQGDWGGRWLAAWKAPGRKGSAAIRGVSQQGRRAESTAGGA